MSRNKMPTSPVFSLHIRPFSLSLSEFLVFFSLYSWLFMKPGVKVACWAWFCVRRIHWYVGGKRVVICPGIDLRQCGACWLPSPVCLHLTFYVFFHIWKYLLWLTFWSHQFLFLQYRSSFRCFAFLLKLLCFVKLTITHFPHVFVLSYSVLFSSYPVLCFNSLVISNDVPRNPSQKYRNINNALTRCFIQLGRNSFFLLVDSD